MGVLFNLSLLATPRSHYVRSRVRRPERHRDLVHMTRTLAADGLAGKNIQVVGWVNRRETHRSSKHWEDGLRDVRPILRAANQPGGAEIGGRRCQRQPVDAECATLLRPTLAFLCTGGRSLNPLRDYHNRPSFRQCAFTSTIRRGIYSFIRLSTNLVGTSNSPSTTPCTCVGRGGFLDSEAARILPS